MEEMLILVDQDDNPIGTAEKLFVHQQGMLHRAFSIFIFDRQGRLLLQQRAQIKYHSASLWTNSCCGHPRWGETTIEAANRRLQEEMGVATTLQKVSSFTYHAHVPGSLIEHELDHIFVGFFNGTPQVNPDEAMSWEWVNISSLLDRLKTHPEQFTAWFKIIINNIKTKELQRWATLAIS